MRTARPEPTGFAAKAKDLQALRDAVDQAATVSGALWLSYIFVFLYLAIAAGAVTHKDLFFENPVKLPFLNVELPLIAFFTLGPLLFLIVHAYTLLHFAMLAGKVGAFHAELEVTIPLRVDREDLRRQLPSNIFVQFLAGPRGVRTGVFGLMLRLIAWISLIIGPVALLVFFELQFLPYHDPVVTWWHRVAVFIDLILLWILWPRVAPIKATSALGRSYYVGLRIIGLTGLSLLSLVLVTTATFRGEWLHNVFNVPPGPLHQFLVGGEVDDVAQRQKSWWSNRLVVPGIDLREHTKFDTKEKIESRTTTLRLRKRHFEDAILENAYLPKADLTGAELRRARMRSTQLPGASLHGAQLQEARLDLAPLERAQLQDASLFLAQLKGARLDGAQLQGATLVSANMQGARLDEAELQGATLVGAQLHGASLAMAQLQGASLDGAELQGALLDLTQLQGASLREAQLQDASLFGAQPQGASLAVVSLQRAFLFRTFVWRADAAGMNLQKAYVGRLETGSKYSDLDCYQPVCDWSESSYAALQQLIVVKVLSKERRLEALARIAILDPAIKIEMGTGIWAELEKNRPKLTELTEDGKSLAERLTNIGCKAGRAPNVGSALIERLWRGLQEYPAQTSIVANMFLDEKTCPGARGLSEEEKAALRKIRDHMPPPLAAPEPPKKNAAP